MPTYTFHLRRLDAPVALDMVELPHDQATFAKAGQLLHEHQSCDHVEVWAGERPVVARYREQPIIRPVPSDSMGAERAQGFPYPGANPNAERPTLSPE
jgi:hypothetical protein